MPEATNSLQDIAKQVDSVIAASEKRLEDVNKQVHAANIELNNITGKIKHHKQHLNTAAERLKSFEVKANARMFSIEQDIKTRQALLDKTKEILQETERKVADNTADSDRLAKHVRDLNEQAATLNTVIEDLEEKRANIASELSEDRAKAQKTIDGLTERIGQLNNDLRAQQNAIDTAVNEGRRELERLNKTKDELTTSIKDLSAKEATLVDTVAELQDRAARFRAESEESIRSLKARESEVEARERKVKIREQEMSTRLRRAV